METNRRTGIVLVALGALFLLGRAAVGGGWPLFVVGPGLVLLAVALLGPRSSAGLAVPGSIVTVVGVVLWLQAATGRFETWSYAWGLVLAAVGVGIFLESAIRNRPEGGRDGLRLAALGLALFAGFGIFFEFLIFRPGLRGASGWVLPLLLIAGGVWMLARRARA